MIEGLMLFSLGFLTANLLVLGIIPFIQNRAERLTIKRLEASIPLLCQGAPQENSHRQASGVRDH